MTRETVIFVLPNGRHVMRSVEQPYRYAVQPPQDNYWVSGGSVEEVLVEAGWLKEPKGYGGAAVGDEKTKVLEDFCKTIEATGGLNAEGNPVADEDWIDLGDCYASACEILGRKVMQESSAAGENA